MDVSMLNDEFKDLKLPPRDRGSSSRASAETTVTTNLFNLDFVPGMKVYKYRVDVKKMRGEKEIDLTKGIRSDTAVQQRKRACRSLFEDCIKKAEKDGKPWTDDKYTYLYDCGNILYSSKPFQCFSEAEPSVGIRLLPSVDISSEFSRNYVGHNAECILVTLEPTLEFQLSLNEDHCPRETQQFLEVLTSAALVRNGDHFNFKNKFYGKTSRYDVPIKEAKCIKPERGGQPMALLQLDAKKSPFFIGENLIKICCELLEVRELEDLDPQSIRKLTPQLKGLVVKTIHTPKDKVRYFHIANLSKERVKDISFEVDGQQTSMVDFFKQKYNYNIKYSRTPCVIEKSSKKMCMYPLEVLEVERGQRVNSQKSSRRMAENMIKECRMNPGDLKDYIQGTLKECCVGNDNKYLQNFKVKITPKMEYTAGRVLFPPAIKYARNQTVEPTRDGTLNWKITREHFLKAANIGTIAFIVFDDCVRERDSEIFLDKMLRSGQEHGMVLPSTRDVEILFMASEDSGCLEDLFTRMATRPRPYIWCVTKQKFDPVHDVLKSFEAKHGVVTQHVSQPVLSKALGNQGAFLVINNLLMKMNLKASGVNHMVDMSKSFQDANRGGMTSEIIFPKNRMIFGFDVSHAGPQSFSDRALGVKQSEPSVVGMSFSKECVTEVGGCYWMQEPRFAGISGIAQRVQKALELRLQIVGKLPDDIVIYRGGVSEGEYQKVITEVDQFKEAFACQPGYHPSVTCIVVLTNSNFRLFPERIDTRAKPMDQNVRPGTVVDTEITNPFYNEFLIVSQKGIMGTVRPCRCVVVVSEKGTTGTTLTMDAAQQLTYCLSYGHQVVTASTSLPLPLTAATNLSKRGRNNWKEANYREADARSALSGGSGDNGVLRHDGSETFFDKISTMVESKLVNHFWA